MSFNFKLNITKPSISSQQSLQQTQLQQQIIEKPQTKPMKWGEPTWFLFHTLAYKIKDEYFMQIKNDLLNNCFMICRNLPCPMCAEHATEYMKKINFNAIQTKEQLKDLFFNFHNTVNQRKGFPLFERNNLDSKYSIAVTKNIIQHFINHFKDKSRTIRNISNDFFREKALIYINNWFSNNIQYFND